MTTTPYTQVTYAPDNNGRPTTSPRTTLGRELTRRARVGDLPLTPRSEPTIDLARGLLELDIHRPDYEQAERVYKGKNPELFSHPRIARVLRGTADRYKLNFAKIPVDAVADRLTISSVIIKQNDPEVLDYDDTPEDDPTSPRTPSPDDQLDDYTRQFKVKVWDPLKLRRKTAELHQKVAMYGDAYWFIWPEDPNAPDPQPTINYNSPLTTRMIYSLENPEEPEFIIKCWGGNAILYYTDQIEFYYLKPNAPENQRKDGTAWELWDVLENPFDMLPVFHFSNRDPYGVPEHYEAYGAQDAINKMSTTLVHTSEYQGFPQRFMLTDPNAEIAGDGNDNDGWDDETAHSDRSTPDTNENSANESGPGTILNLKANAAGQFQPAPPDHFLNPINFYIKSISTLTNTPMRFMNDMPQRPNADAARQDEAPFIRKVRKRSEYMEDTYRDAFSFAFSIVNDEDPTERPYMVDVRWTPFASIDDALGWDTVRRKIEAGVPRRVALIEAGYTVEQVDSWLAENQDRATFQADIKTLETASLAIRNLANAAHEGLIDQQSAAEALAKLLTRLLGQTITPPDPNATHTTPPNTVDQDPFPPTNQPTNDKLPGPAPDADPNVDRTRPDND